MLDDSRKSNVGSRKLAFSVQETAFSKRHSRGCAFCFWCYMRIWWMSQASRTMKAENDELSELTESLPSALGASTVAPRRLSKNMPSVAPPTTSQKTQCGYISPAEMATAATIQERRGIPREFRLR